MGKAALVSPTSSTATGERFPLVAMAMKEGAKGVTARVMERHGVPELGHLPMVVEEALLGSRQKYRIP